MITLRFDTLAEFNAYINGATGSGWVFQINEVNGEYRTVDVALQNRERFVFTFKKNGWYEYEVSIPIKTIINFDSLMLTALLEAAIKMKEESKPDTEEPKS